MTAFDTHAEHARRLIESGKAKLKGNKNGGRVKRIELIPSDHPSDEHKRGSHGNLVGQTYSFNEPIDGGHAWRHKDLPNDESIEDPIAADQFVRSVFVRVPLECGAVA